MSTPARVFLNTDSLIARIFGHSADVSTLTEAVANRPLVTCWYARLEFFLTIVRDFIWFYEVLGREASLHDALAVFDGEYRPRVRSVVIKTLQALGGPGPNMDEQEQFRYRLGVFTRSELIRLFDHDITAFVGAACWRRYTEERLPLDLAALEERLSPHLEPALPDLLKQHQSALATLAPALRDPRWQSHPKRAELLRIADLCDRTVTDPTALNGHPRLLDQMGDVLIALDAPDDSELLAFDRVFEPLCHTLGQPFRVLPSFRIGSPV